MEHLAFHQNTDYSNFMAVRGKITYGLLIDPGASRGLIGSETLRNIMQHVIKPHNKQHLVSRSKSNAGFSGISAGVQMSLGRVNIPIGLLGVNRATFTADVIGGDSSNCPGLVPLRTLLSHGCLISCGFFGNGDGVLAIKVTTKNGEAKYAAQRLLWTDSGHYLLPIDNFGRRSNDKLDRAAAKQAGDVALAAEEAQLQQSDAVTLLVFSHDTDEQSPALQATNDMEDEENSDTSEEMIAAADGPGALAPVFR